MTSQDEREDEAEDGIEEEKKNIEANKEYGNRREKRNKIEL